ncbi:MAG: ParB/RepB/Spo0J family partition protein [Bacillota bacterium]|nr:ParB/RepB/Spo0J family partition protein [Bacillota bacterium]
MAFLTKEENKVLDIPILQIRPNKTQPRQYFNEEELKNLAQSIAANGILQPLTVRRISQNEYELIAGERRLRAAVMAGFIKVPCILVKCNDKESAVFALLENLQRSDLGMFEEARGINRLINKCGLTQEQAASQLGKKQSTVANKLRLLKLTYEEQDWIIQSGLTERHARALLKIDNIDLRKEIMSKIIADSLNVSQTDQLVEQMLAPAAEKRDGRAKTIVVKDIRIFLNTINKAVDTMRLSGIDAYSKKEETEDYIEYTVKIPKSCAFKHRSTSNSA